MRRLLPALLAAAALALPSAALAQGFDDPVAFVRERYARYQAGEVPQTWPDRPYSPRLARLFERLAAVEGGEERIEFDWWVNGQDFELDAIEVLLEQDRGDRRTVLARWRNFGQADASRFLFVRRDGRWYLDEVISTTSDWRLSQVLRDAAR